MRMTSCPMFFYYYDEICFNSPLRNELPIYNKAIGVPVATPVLDRRFRHTHKIAFSNSLPLLLINHFTLLPK